MPLQGHYPPGATVLGVINASDATLLTVGTGNQKAHLAWLTITAINSYLRTKGSYHGYVPFGFFPIPDFLPKDGRDIPSDVVTLLRSRIHHQCLDKILRNVKICAKAGEMMQDPYGNWRFCFTPAFGYTVDLEEANHLVGIQRNVSHVTMASPRDIGSPTIADFRTTKLMLEHIAATTKAVDPWDIAAFMEESHKRNILGVHRPFYRDWFFAEIWRMFILDVLHTIHKGFRDHDWEWLCKALKGYAEANRRLCLFQPIVGRRWFKKGVGKEQVTGRTYRDMQRFIVALTQGTAREFQRCITALLKIRYLTCLDVVSTKALEVISQELVTFFTLRDIILKNRYRKKQDWQIPKIDLLKVIVTNIVDSGALQQYSTETPESGNHAVVKVPYNSTNHKDPVSQICRVLDRWERMRTFAEQVAMTRENLGVAEDLPEADIVIDEQGENLARPPDQLPHWLHGITSGKYHIAGPKRTQTNWFSKLSDDVPSSPNHTFTGLGNSVVYHLTNTPDTLTIEAATTRYRLDDFRDALELYFPDGLENAASKLDSKFLVDKTRSKLRFQTLSLSFEKVRVWDNLRIQRRSIQAHHRVLPADQVQAWHPAKDQSWPQGRYDFCLVSKTPALPFYGPISMSGESLKSTF
jgi:hypothetical protein